MVEEDAEQYKATLKSAGFLTRDSRMKERKNTVLRRLVKRLSSPNVNRWRRRIIDSQLVDPVSEDL